ncbi:hypothetical protein GYD31_004628 [Salmonella enterica]|nr:hypothetical protein [Salmonella enterica]
MGLQSDSSGMASILTVATSARTLKPWEALGISRAWYYQLKKRGLVE